MDVGAKRREGEAAARFGVEFYSWITVQRHEFQSSHSYQKIAQINPLLSTLNSFKTASEKLIKDLNKT